MAVLRASRQTAKDTDIHVSPLDAYSLHRPTELLKKRDNIVSHQFVLPWKVTKGVSVRIEPCKVMDPCHEVLYKEGNVLQGRLLLG
jgi:hypothetical protein